MAWSSKDNANRLRDIAAPQDGFFTTAQATEAGYVDAVHGYHVQNGDWERCCRGVYRLTDHPAADWPELIIWSLWSRGRDGKPQGVYSHETAAMIHGALPRTAGVLHMTVPKSFRKSCDIPHTLCLHKEEIPEDFIEYRRGFAVLRSSPRTSPSAPVPYDRIIDAGED